MSPSVDVLDKPAVSEKGSNFSFKPQVVFANPTYANPVSLTIDKQESAGSKKNVSGFSFYQLEDSHILG